MSTLFPKTIQYESYNATETAGDYNNDGDWVPGDTEVLTFQGGVQPAKGKEIEALNIGRQDMGMVKVYSPIPLAVSVEGGDTTGDVVYYDNKKWELVYDGGYQNGLIPHYKYMAVYKEPIV